MDLQKMQQPLQNFNPLPRKEGDSVNLGAIKDKKISIHSLVKRETGRTGCLSGQAHEFQSTPS